MSDDRADRLRKNRNQVKNRAQGNTASTNDQSQSETSKQSKPSEPSNSSKQETANQSSEDAANSTVKQDQVGTYMYLPERQHQELSRQFNLLKAEYEYEYNEEFEKNRHFYPLIIRYGLDSLEGLDASEIQEKLDSLDVQT
jgi:hypothetical protein